MFNPSNLPKISFSKQSFSCTILETNILIILKPIGSKSSLIVWIIRL